MSRRLDQVVVLNDVCVAQGGATHLALRLTGLLAERGIRTTFITADEGHNPALAGAGVPVLALGQKRLLDAKAGEALLRGLFNRATGPAIRGWIDRHDSAGTVYHLHTWSKTLSPSVFRALAPVRQRLVVTAHDFFLACPNGAYAQYRRGDLCAYTPLGPRCLASNCDRRSYSHKLWRVARQAVQRATLRFEGGRPQVLAIMDGMAPLLERGGVPREAITTVLNPVRPWSAERIAAEHNREILFVGRLEPEKGPDLAAEAARRAGVRLRIVGDGSMMEALRASYPECIFDGRLPPEGIAAAARKARMLIVPSRYPEPYGLVAGEALWSGLPVLITDLALLAAPLVERGAGLAFDPRGVEALVAQLRRLADDDEVVRAMSLNAFTRTRDLGATDEQWMAATLASYDRALEEAP